VTSAPTQRRHTSSYEHLAPLFVEYGRLRAGDPRRARLREELIRGYRPVAVHIARRYLRRGESPDDLEQVATLGLILAVDRFQQDRGIDFLSFAVPTITGEVLRHYRDRSTPIRLPRRLRDMQGRIHDAAAELEQQRGRAPRPSEIADALGVDREEVLEALAALGAQNASSLDEPPFDDDGTPGDRTRFEGALGRTETGLELVEQRETLAPLVHALPKREQTILLLRFFDGRTQTEIGAQLGISQMHVSRLLARTLTTLRRRAGVS
jgi:RNA polymerase sigma-B factor